MQATINDRASMSATMNGRARMSASPSTGVSGTTDYEVLTNKPSINGHELTGNQIGHDLGLANLSDIPVYNLIKTNLWSYATDNNNNIAWSTGTYYLHDNINNYDMIVIELASYTGDMSQGNPWNGSGFITLYPHILNNAYYSNRVNICTFSSRSTNFEIKDDYISKRIDNEGGTNGIVNVWGVKLGAIV